jgi:hypothetical protein
MKERLIEFLAYLGIGQTKFEEKVGLSRGLINNIKGNISLNSLKKIEDAYPELNENWLKTGEGEMLKNNQQIGDIAHSTVVGANVNGNGIKITHNDLSGMIELQKGYQDMIKKSQEQIDRLIGIVEQFNK